MSRTVWMLEWSDFITALPQLPRHPFKRVMYLQKRRHVIELNGDGSHWVFENFKL